MLKKLLNLQQHYKAYLQQLAKKNEITVAEWRLLEEINDGQTTQAMLVADTGLDVSTLSRQITRLLKKDLITAVKAKHDKSDKRKAYRYNLTSKGTLILNQMNSDFNIFSNEMLAEWSDADRNLFAKLIENLDHSLALTN